MSCSHTVRFMPMRQDIALQRGDQVPILIRWSEGSDLPVDLTDAVLELRVSHPGGTITRRSDVTGSGLVVEDQARPELLGCATWQPLSGDMALLPANRPVTYALRAIRMGAALTILEGALLVRGSA